MDWLSQSFFWGGSPRPPLGSAASSPNPFRKVLMVGSMKRFALPSVRVLYQVHYDKIPFFKKITGFYHSGLRISTVCAISK
jgi:hypothetical protein